MENETIKGRVIRDNKNLFEKKEKYYKPARVGNFYFNNYTEYDTWIHGTSDTWKIELTIAINFISSKDNDEVHVIHSKSNNIEITTYDKAYEASKNFLNRFLKYIKLGWKHK